MISLILIVVLSIIAFFIDTIIYKVKPDEFFYRPLNLVKKSNLVWGFVFFVLLILIIISFFNIDKDPGTLYLMGLAAPFISLVLFCVSRDRGEKRISNHNKGFIRDLTDQAALAKIAMNDFGWSEKVIGKINDQVFLNEIAKNAASSYARKYAIEKITDQVILVEIAKNDTNSMVRNAAVKKVMDQMVLSEIAKNDVDFGVRSTAVEQINDRAILAEIAEISTGHYFKETVLKRIADLSVAAKVTTGRFEKSNSSSPDSQDRVCLFISSGSPSSTLVEQAKNNGLVPYGCKIEFANEPNCSQNSDPLRLYAKYLLETNRNTDFIESVGATTTGVEFDGSFYWIVRPGKQ